MKPQSKGLDPRFRFSGQSFSFIELGDLVDRGVRHGFIGRELDFSGDADLGTARLLAEFGREVLILPRQVHGARILEFLDPAAFNPITLSVQSRPEGDAILFRRGISQRHVFGIRTSDCVPLIVSCGDFIGLIHAGWRGLANGIISTTLARLRELVEASPMPDLHVVIGPCAGRLRYEVGSEVGQAIGSATVCTKLDSGKLLLDLQETAIRLIEATAGLDQRSIACVDICTITDPDYFSYRRAENGSNLTFVLS